jgi:hypothetical protein
MNAKTFPEIDIERLHNTHFAPIVKRDSGQTIYALMQLIGYLQVVENENIVVLLPVPAQYLCKYFVSLLIEYIMWYRNDVRINCKTWNEIEQAKICFDCNLDKNTYNKINFTYTNNTVFVMPEKAFEEWKKGRTLNTIPIIDKSKIY